MTRTFVILLIVAALLFLGIYFFIAFYNSFVGGIAAAGSLIPIASFTAGRFQFTFEP